jgi:heme exporter protein A
MAPPAVVLSDVSKRFGPRWAVARLSYSLPAGRALLLTGHNGSGKTTLMRMIATAQTPTAGEISIFGLDARTARDEIRERVALLSHASFLYEDLSARENLEVCARLLGLGGAAARARTAALLGQVGLSARAEHPLRQFSAGMRKRLAIARVLLKEPELALLDEPFGELDPEGISQMEEIIRGLRQRGTTVILATHLVDQGRALCDEQLHLSHGRVALA